MRNRIFWQFSITIPLALAGVTATTSGNHVLAQLDPDNSLGAENSIVTPQQLRDLIQGGAIRGNALFHSFDEFNVGSDRGVFFDLQNNTDILNIFTRVTGGNVSNILGTLGVLQDALNSNVLGNANLFLLNPNGITFGANANLQLNGSFFATTADGFGFDNFTFSASGQEAPPPLLTISIPRFASFRDNPGDIAVNQSNLTVNQGQSLSLVGGNVTVTGSGDITNLQGTVNAPGGRIELGGLTVAETVNINPDLSLVFPDGVARGDVSLTDAATLSVVSNAADLNGGSVALTGQNLSITRDSAILGGIGAGFGGDGVTAGDIDLNATGEITISDSTSGFLISGELTQGRGVQNRLNQGATGTGGNVNVTADSLSITNGGFISISTLGFGDSGNTTVNVNGAVTIDGVSDASSRFSNVVTDTAVGNSGDIIINAGSVSLTNGGVINTNVFAPTFDDAGVQLTPGGVGNGGNVNITTDFLSLTNDASINTTTFGEGDAGDIIINASESVTLTDGSQFQALTLGSGNAGNITINAEDADISLDNNSLIGTSPIDLSISIFGLPPSAGEGGDININARSLSLTSSSGLLAFTAGQVDAGDIRVNVTDTVQIEGTSSISSAAIVNLGGNAGSINIDSEAVIIRDGGVISVDNQGNSLGENLGNIDIISNTLTLDNGRITANSTSTTGGNITLNISDYILLLNGDGTPDLSDSLGGSLALISADSQGNGGNITLNTTALIAIPGQDSDITANSVGGSGGLIQVNADNVFGIQESGEDIPGSNDITVISGLGSQFSGQVIFNTPEINSGQEQIEKPEEVVNPSDIVSQSVCSDFGGDSQLANTGRGGVPQIPGFIIRNDTVDVDLVDEVLPAPPPEAIKPHHRTTVTFLDSNGEEFKPAMGAVLLPNGMVQFVDYNPTEVYRDMYAAAGCSH